MQEFIVFLGLIIAGLIACAISYPKVFICIVMFIAATYFFFHFTDRIDREKLKKELKDVKNRYPKASEDHQEAIAEKVRCGARIDNFIIEEGILGYVLDRKTTYWRASGAWTETHINSDVGKLYEAERNEIEQKYLEWELSTVEVHDLSVQMYFNWKITHISRDEKGVVVELHRRGDNRRLVYPR